MVYFQPMSPEEFESAMAQSWNWQSSAVVSPDGQTLPDPTVAAVATQVFLGKQVEADYAVRLRAEVLVSAIGATVFSQRSPEKPTEAA